MYDHRFDRRSFLKGLAATGAVGALGPVNSLFAQSAAGSAVLIEGARVFDGDSPDLLDGQSVLIQGNRIARIAPSIPAPSGATVIDASGRTLTPGFMDAHAHVMLQMSIPEVMSSDEYYYAYVATQTAEVYLMNGFTTIRDASGNCFSLKRAIDRGIVTGPRIYPSGPMISQTSGHSDFRTDAHRSALVADEMSAPMRYNMVQIADGRAEVLAAVRENLRRGASQIKIATGGGVTSFADPLDSVQYTDDEIRAAVEAAADWGTYVMTHVYNAEGARRAVENGVKSIEHGNLLDEETLLLMQEREAWLSPQVLYFTSQPQGYGEDQLAKLDEALAGLDNLFTIAKEIGFEKIAFGTDAITDPQMVGRISEEFALRTQWFDPVEILRQATSKNGQLMALSGPRNPYPGTLGRIEEGALADLLLINGNPLEDISILTTPEETLALIMKDGQIHKNTIA